MITFRNTTVEDINHVATNMRQADIEEVVALGRTPRQALTEGLTQSMMCVSACEDNVPFAIYGMVPDSLTGDSAAIWMLGTDEVFNNKRAMAEYAPEIINQMHTMYPILYNYVHVENKVSIRWLKRLGFEFEPEINGFMRFSKCQRS